MIKKESLKIESELVIIEEDNLAAYSQPEIKELIEQYSSKYQVANLFDGKMKVFVKDEKTVRLLESDSFEYVSLNHLIYENKEDFYAVFMLYIDAKKIVVLK